MNNTTALQNFATTARRTLNEQMRARITQLLDDVPAKLEYPREVAMLTAAVTARGVNGAAEEAAYTWFNRLTAARYMDSKGFSGLYQIVSPGAGSASALPEILTRAHAGAFPDEVPDAVRSDVIDLLSGARVSQNADLEAYTLLTQAVFRAWHNPMPEVFPAAVDWIRLLIPSDLLAPNSVRAQAIQVMDDQACKEVEVVGWLYQFYNAELKAQIDKAKTLVGAAEIAPKTQLFTPHWIVQYLVQNSLGRLWLRSKPSSGLRTSMKYYVEPVPGQSDTGVTVSSPQEIRVVDPACGSGHMLTYAFDLLYDIYEEEGLPASQIPELILRNNLRGLEIDTRAAQLASFALAMKARTKDRRFLTRDVRPDIVHIEAVSFSDDEVQIIVNAVVHEDATVDRVALARLLYAFQDADTFGSLIRVEGEVVEALDIQLDALEHGVHALYVHHAVDRLKILVRQAKSLTDRQYHVAVANPPYLGSGNMGGQLRAFAKKEYPKTKSDLYAMFIERSLELATASGSVAMITMHSWMFLTSYTNFRLNMIDTGHLKSMIHLGTRAFDSIDGEVVQTAAFVIDVDTNPDIRAIFIRLTEAKNEQQKSEALLQALENGEDSNRFESSLNDSTFLKSRTIAYWTPAGIRNAFKLGTPLRNVSPPRLGLCTGDNGLFIRHWFEVSAAKFNFGAKCKADAENSLATWFPYNKGGGYRRWWGNQSLVVNWRNGGEDCHAFAQKNPNGGTRIQNTEFYFQKCISWSNVSTDTPTFRYYPSSFMFDQKGQAIFPSETQLRTLLGFLNSSAVSAMTEITSPTLSVNAGEIANLPISASTNPAVDRIVDELISLHRADWNDYETSWNFENNPLVRLGTGALEKHSNTRWHEAIGLVSHVCALEMQNNEFFAAEYSLQGIINCQTEPNRATLVQNPYSRYAPTKGSVRSDLEYRELFNRDLAIELVSFGVGCAVGRYSLSRPGLVLADAGSGVADFDRVVPDAQFRPSINGIIPITAERYFEDDIVTRMREFLATAFGPENLEANVVWLEQALGNGKPLPLRKYFLEKFHADHVQMYSKRPIYWQVSSPNGGFNALFYLHRYTPATLGLIHQNYAEEYCAKLEARIEHIDHALLSAAKGEAAKLGKEREGLAKELRGVRTWIDGELFPAATAEIPLDLDDGVKQNYPKLEGVVKPVSGL
ncbi:BREX-1 system adenine-specific DNA-methyltransferase PglX [Nocardia sp. NPDC006630]|uniref:BREX-1 system adenine-specific DNA-methyltransferase PglX n=1 Tax=Nocardia sp. NPDC006630 TaxID=3157181 RepID=UPI0033B5B9D6